MEATGGTKPPHLSLENLHNGTNTNNNNSFEPPTSSHDDFLEQMLSSLPNSPWPDLSNHSPASNPNPNPNPKATSKSPWDPPPPLPHVHGDSSPMAAAKSFLLQQQLLLPLVGDLPSFKSSPQGTDGAVQALFNGFSPPPLQPQQPFQAGAMAAQPFGGQGPPAMSQPPASASTGGSGGQAPQRQRVRARRGQATDPHSIAERLRRERIAERMKALQELVPNGNKTDKASMLDEIIDYVKFLQLQVKVLSMSRLGGAGAAPRIADLSSEGGASGGIGRTSNGNPGIGSSADGMSVTEHQVVKLMEEDMGSAMQYLQGKGLCLMPISLATAISTATAQPRNNGSLHNNNHRQQHQPNGGEGPTPNLSALTVQSANLINGDGSVKDSNPASKA